MPTVPFFLQPLTKPPKHGIQKALVSLRCLLA